MKKAVILLSGGLDSTTTLYYALNKGYRLHALIFDYGQRHKKEINCAKKVADINKVPYTVVKINLSWTKSSLTQTTMRVPSKRKLTAKTIPSTYVAGRNIIFLSYAFSLAESINAKTIFIGAHIQDYSGYPDCRPEFLKHFQAAVNKGMKRSTIRIKAPLLTKNKKQIIKLGYTLGVPFQYTWSCYSGGKHPCGTCDSCRFRIAAFKQLNITIPST